jgi:O-antigen/teichoic acid export membrane protein
LISGAGLSLLFFLSAPSFSSIYTQPDLTPIIRWFSVSFVFINLVRIASSATRITQKVKYSIFIDDLIQPILYFSLVVLFYLLGNKLLGALVANVISFSVAALTALYFVFRQFYKGNGLQREFSDSYRNILLFSMPTAFTGVLGAANNWIDRLLIGFFRPAADIGVYQAASQSSMLFVIILTAISTIFGPMIADLFHKAEHVRLRQLYQTSTRWGFYLGLPIFVVVCFYAQEIMTVVFGGEYASGAVPMLILNIGQMFNLSTGTVGFLLIMTGNQNKWLGITGFSLMINIVLNLILTYYFGIVGTAIATAFSIFMLYTGGIILAYRTLQVFPYERKMLKGIGAAVISVLVLLAINWALPGYKGVNFVFGSGIICFVFLVCLFGFGLEKEDRMIFQMLKSKFHNKL